MKIKYKKIIKIFISILILSTNVCSFATVNSDGSAFVTGEEFNKALGDFKKRLTTFEAGINSKIDAQVSSYLDRNGIWNPTEQTTNPVPTDSFGWRADKFMNGYNIYCWVNGAIYNLGGSSYALQSYNMDVAIVDKIQKSGLANVVINFTENTNFSVFGVYSSDPNTHQDWYGCCAVSDEYITITNEKGSEDRYNINWTTQLPMPVRYGIFYPKQLAAYIFVDKGDKMSFRFNGKYVASLSPMHTTNTSDFRIKITDWEVNVY